MKDLYAVLGVPQNASLDDIKKAYRALAGQYHPDRTQGDANLEAKFKEAKEAYEILSDPGKRQEYDDSGKVAVLEDPHATARELWSEFIHNTLKGLV